MPRPRHLARRPYRIWRRPDGRFAISTENYALKRRKPFYVADTIAGCMNCPQLRDHREKVRRKRLTDPDYRLNCQA